MNQFFAYVARRMIQDIDGDSRYDLYAAHRLSSTSTKDSVVGSSPTQPMNLSLVSSSHLESTLVSSLPDQAQRSRLGCASDLPHRASTSCSLDHSAEKEDFVTQFLHSSHDPHQDMIKKKFDKSQHFNSRAKQQTITNMNEHIDVQLIISDSDQSNVFVPQLQCFAVTIQRFVQIPHLVFA